MSGHIKKLASQLLKAELKKKFDMDIDPDHTYFLHFDWAMSDSGAFTGFSHIGKPIEERTLTECLFSNFPADAQEIPMLVDQQAGIYKKNSKAETEFNGSNQVKIRPSDFMEVIWNLDFYNVEKDKMRYCLDNEGLHKINNAVSFSLKLSESKSDLNENDIDNLLRGVSYKKNNGETEVYPFDINGYEATDMLVFEEKRSGNRVLYMPRRERSFIAFRGELEMREWIINNCADKEHRESIAHHFSIEKRQDGIVYYGVDHWLKTFENIVNANSELGKICSKKNEIQKDEVFSYITEQQKNRVFSDLDKFIVSDREIRKQMWMRFFDAGNMILPNPITPFISLGFHIDRMVNGDTLRERINGWHQVGSDIANLILMATLESLTEFEKIDFDVNENEFVSCVEKDLLKFNENKEIAFDRILPVEKFSPKNLDYDVKATSLFHDSPIKTTEDVLSKLIEKDFKFDFGKLSSPNERGIMKLLSDNGRGETKLIRIGDRFFEIEETNEFGNYVIGGKDGVEVFFDRSMYHEKISNVESEIIYKSCLRGKRSPNSPCLSFSEDVDNFLNRNIDKAIF